ncbi:O-antigen ligase family protein [Acinetobacter entericus]|uniref:O-antigen ligase-related domain-containing protein n=1 Tax=Acinetobacter entericus TaxID=2989714 RepID=A0ABT3NHS8_9GAMM|nr:O-antigen ligase family protein [Acinetobacter entericus]MCW8039110.1 hypothetical protein [Acinetobacter entericus]
MGSFKILPTKYLELFLMKSNRFDIYISLIFFILIFGVYGGALQPIRLLAVLLFFYYFPLIYKELSNYKLQSYFLIFSFIYGFCSIFFIIENIKESMISFLYLAINLMLYAVLFVFYKKANNSLMSCFKGVLGFLSIALVYAVYEISTGNHLSVNLTHDVESLMARDYSSFTFGNYNTFLMVLIMMMPFLIYAISNYKFVYKIISAIFLLLISYVVITNASRSATVALCLSYGFLLLYRGSLIFKCAIVICVSYLLINNLSVFEVLINRYDNVGYKSDGRWEVLTLPFDGLKENLLLGFGIGNFGYFASNNLSQMEVYAAHNFFGETLYELGIFFLLFIILILINNFKTFIMKDYKIKVLFLHLVIIFIPFSLINSGYLVGVYVWIFLSLLASISYFEGFKNVK